MNKNDIEVLKIESCGKTVNVFVIGGIKYLPTNVFKTYLGVSYMRIKSIKLKSSRIDLLCYYGKEDEIIKHVFGKELPKSVSEILLMSINDFKSNIYKLKVRKSCEYKIEELLNKLKF